MNQYPMRGRCSIQEADGVEREASRIEGWRLVEWRERERFLQRL